MSLEWLYFFQSKCKEEEKRFNQSAKYISLNKCSNENHICNLETKLTYAKGKKTKDNYYTCTTFSRHSRCIIKTNSRSSRLLIQNGVFSFVRVTLSLVTPSIDLLKKKTTTAFFFSQATPVCWCCFLVLFWSNAEFSLLCWWKWNRSNMSPTRRNRMKTSDH